VLAFEDVLNVNLTKLNEAVTEWTETVDKLKKLAEQANDVMLAKADKAEWRGENAGVTKPFIRKTAKEFNDAATEAVNILKILRDAHTAFKKHKGELEDLLQDARRQELHIDPRGFVRSMKDTPPIIPESSKYVSTPTIGPSSEQAKIDAMVDRIIAILGNTTEVDRTIAQALRTITGKNPHNFTTTEYTNLKDARAMAEAKEASKIAKELANTGTARNLNGLKRLAELTESNANNPVFATTFYDAMGPARSLDFYANVSLDSTSLNDKLRPGLVHQIQNDMGTMLGLATDKETKGHLNETWVNDLLKAGHKELDVSRVTAAGTQIYGYQALGPLLRDGKYDTDFLTTVGRDMIAMEKKDPAIWERNAPLNADMKLNHDETGGRGLNPITGLMEAMSKNPEASSAFFDEPVREDSNKDGIVTEKDKEVKGYDSNYDGKVNKHDTRPMSVVDYMLDRSPAIDANDYITGGEPNPSQTALGNALEAAVTHRQPGDDDAAPVRHTESMSNVMERVVEKIGGDPTLIEGKSEDSPGVLAGISENLGNMAAEYMPDIQMAVENGERLIEPFGVSAEFDKADLQQFLVATAQNPDAYGAINNAQQAYTTTLVHQVIGDPEKYPNPEISVGNAIHPGAEIAGMMTEARAQAIYDRHAHSDAEFNEGVANNAQWSNRIVDAVGGKYIEMIPVGGDVITWVKEDISEAAIERAERDTTDEARKESTQAYVGAETATRASVEAAVVAACRGSDLSTDEIKAIIGSVRGRAASAHIIGRGSVDSATGGS